MPIHRRRVMCGDSEQLLGFSIGVYILNIKDSNFVPPCPSGKYCGSPTRTRTVTAEFESRLLMPAPSWRVRFCSG